MSNLHEDEISEIIEYVTGMRRTFNRKLDDHLFIMEQQNRRIEEQYRIIDDQRAIIDELAWQIRDLRDSVRKVSEQKSNCVCNYENHVSRHRNKDNDVQGTNRQDFRIMRFDEEDEEEQDIYEKVDVKNSNPVQEPRLTPKYTDVFKEKQNKLNEAQSITIDRATRYVRPANSITGLIGRPDINITNSLHDALNRLKIENLAERDSIDEEGTEEILLRTKPFKQFGRNSQRGSSKVMCSLVSDIEEDYLPNEEELNEENFVRISSTHKVPQPHIVTDFNEEVTSSKRIGIVDSAPAQRRK